jgi:hypothetical protein
MCAQRLGDLGVRGPFWSRRDFSSPEHADVLEAALISCQGWGEGLLSPRVKRPTLEAPPLLCNAIRSRGTSICQSHFSWFIPSGYTILKLGHDRFLPDPLLFVYCRPIILRYIFLNYLQHIQINYKLCPKSSETPSMEKTPLQQLFL